MSQVPQELNHRGRLLLKTLIESYIREGQPVGSRALARESGLDLSPATIRNVMLDLEEMGLVSSPYTSAGRVPTVKGYRLFVDSLLTVRHLPSGEVERLKAQLNPDASLEVLLSGASELLSEITHMAGVVMLPRRDQTAIRQIEFLPLSEQRVLAIIVINEKEVQNRILHVERHYTESELHQAANYLTAAFSRRDWRAVREQLLAEMRAAQADMNDSMHTALTIAEQLFAPSLPESGDYVVAGHTNLMNATQFSDLDQLRKLFLAFNEKRDILHLLDQCFRAEGVQIFIGEESGYRVLDECSVVTAPYSVEGEVVGVLGVIGPTRMAYDRVIPVVDVTAKLLGAALNPR